MIAAEFLVDCDVKNQVAVTAEVDVLEHQVPPPHLVVALLDRGDVAPLRAEPCVPADGFNSIEDGLVGCIATAGVLLADVDVVASSMTWRPLAQTCFSRTSFSRAVTGTPRNWCQQKQASHSRHVVLQDGVAGLALLEVAMQVCVQWSMRRCLHRAQGGSSWAETWGPQWRMICAMTRRCGGRSQPAPISSSERVCCLASKLSGGRERGECASL